MTKAKERIQKRGTCKMCACMIKTKRDGFCSAVCLMLFKKQPKQARRRKKTVKKVAVLSRLLDADTCHYCGRALIFYEGNQYPLSATMDHVIPRSKGGDDSLGNLVVCCNQCNGIKADENISHLLENEDFQCYRIRLSEQ